MLFWSVICRFKFIGEFDFWCVSLIKSESLNWPWSTKILGQFVACMHMFIGQSDVDHIMTSPIKTITWILKASTDIITNIPARSIGLAKTLTIMSVSTFKIAVILYLLLHVFQIDWLIVGFLTSNSLYLLSKHNLGYHQYVHPCGIYIIWCL